MEYYKRVPQDENATHEERDAHRENQAIESLKYTEAHLDEIKAIFQVQLNKPGHENRAVAVEEILKYWFFNDKEKRDRGDMSYVTWSSLYAHDLITTANIIEAANNNDKQALIDAMQKLPWGDSNSGDQSAFNGTQFAFWILSDEDRVKFADVFEEFLRKSNFCYSEPEKAIHFLKNFAELKNLPQLIEYNQEKIAEIKAKQPGDNQN